MPGSAPKIRPRSAGFDHWPLRGLQERVGLREEELREEELREEELQEEELREEEYLVPGPVSGYCPALP